MLEPQPHQQRVLDEAFELSTRLNALNMFLDGSVFRTLPVKERELLTLQATAMSNYLDILKQRIELWETTDDQT